MAEWTIETTGQYDRDSKYYSKKHPEELTAVLDNLDTYLLLLNACAGPFQATAGFIHNEPDGMKAIDQKGSKSRNKLQQTRLSIYAHHEKQILYLLGIGGKSGQGEDIQRCREFVRLIRTGG
jgi:hypothetical protein